MISNFDPYLFLFKDSLFASLLLVPRDEYAVDIMLMLDSYDKSKIYLLAVLANLMGCILNYLLGRMLRSLENSDFMKDQVSSLIKAEKWYAKWGLVTLFFASVPLWGGAIACAAGVLKFKIRLFVTVTLLVNMIFYWFKIFN